MEFFDPIITVRRDGTTSPLKEITENIKVINNIILLSEIPSKSTKVQVTGSIDSVAYTFFELPIGSTLSIDSTNKYVYFSVDYIIGHVQFSSELNGEILSFHYFGQGAHYTPASRCYSQYQDNGNGNYDIIETVQDIVDHLTNLIPQGTWSSTTTYSKNNIINYNNFSYISLQDDNANHIPVGDVNDTYWQLLSGINNFEYKNNWNGTIQYYKNNIIFYTTNNSSYICIADVKSATAPNVDTTHWKPLADLTSINTAEISRVTAEGLRDDAEIIRDSNEDIRIENESTRQTQETIRQNQETARVNAENARVESGALIKTGGTMSGGIIMSNENGITFGNIKVAKNSSLNCLEISWI